MRADVCVIGSGAGGAPLAATLAEGGMRVVMLEEGEAVTPERMTARPRDMTARLYRDAGQFATRGAAPILLPLGRAVGGTTVVNSGTCFRTPDRVLARWAESFGLESLAPGSLDPYFECVERDLRVTKVTPQLAGGNAAVVKRGADALGWSGDYVRRNAHGCVGSGVCAFGCPTGAKQHVGQVYVPRARAAGAAVRSGCRARRIVVERGRARAVDTDGPRVEADTIVVACGAVHTPLLLARSGLGTGSTQLGRNLAIHPATAVRALFDEEIDMAHGVPQSYYVDEFEDEGIMLEGAAGPPDYLATSFPFSRERHRDLMLRYRNLSQFGLMVADRARGEVRERFGRPVVRYELTPEDVHAFRSGIERLTELYWAAGARAVYLPIAGVPELRNGDPGALRTRPLRARDLTLMAFHPLGTARAHADPEQGVVDANLGVHGVAGLYVSDASVVPSSLGVNPQVTIMALALRLADHLLSRV